MDMSVWFLVGAALVFFMQAGFAMVETGFTRAKNAGNIIMKNLMDFCIGSVVFILLGYGIMNSENYIAGLIGLPTYQMFTDFGAFNWSNFVFQLVFCATAATIVSGAMAERTKFSMYCVYSAVISAVVYPIEAGWVWNGAGWLFNLGYIDFAGSSVIHMVGGITALIGAAIVGPRIGKFDRDQTGKIVKVNAIPGHSIPLGALGCFILWFGWYGFNGAAAADVDSMAQIFGTTTLAPAFATCTVMIFTWIKYGKPDVSMTLNGSLAGLVAVTAGCANVDAVGASVIGIVSGFLVCFGVWFLDNKLHIDDPVGAVAVHGFNGCFGTLAVGLFDYNTGLFYGGGIHTLAIQALGVVSIGAYAAVMMFLVFKLIDVTVGLRVKPEEEIEGMDLAEHGLVSAYADFAPLIANAFSDTNLAVAAAQGFPPVPQTGAPTPVHMVTKPAPAVPSVDGMKYTKVTIVCNQARFEALKDAMNSIGVTGMTVTQVMGCGVQKGKTEFYRGVPVNMNLLPKLQVDIVVSTVSPSSVVQAAKNALYTGKVGDGKIFLYDVENIIRVRTNEEGVAALTGPDGD